jgi:hypothetical protein
MYTEPFERNPGSITQGNVGRYAERYNWGDQLLHDWHLVAPAEKSEKTDAFTFPVASYWHAAISRW